MNVCHSETSSIGCGASYGCTQRAESGAAMSHYMRDLIPRCVGFLAAITGLHIHHIHHIHTWDCLVIFRSACWSICNTASCHRLLGFHHLPPFPEHSWARWSIFPYDWQQRSVVAALQIMDFLCFLYHLHGLRHHNSDEFPCFKRLVVDLLRLVCLMRFSGQPCIRIDEQSGCTGLLGILEGALYVSECRWDPLKGWWIDAWNVGIITWYHWFGRTFKTFLNSN